MRHYYPTFGLTRGKRGNCNVTDYRTVRRARMRLCIAWFLRPKIETLQYNSEQPHGDQQN